MSDALSQDIHAGLLNDVTGQYRAALLHRLRGLQDNCVVAKRKLNDRDTFVRLQAAEAAVDAAMRIVEAFPKARR